MDNTNAPSAPSTPQPQPAQPNSAPTLQSDTRACDGTFQTTADWMRRGGQNPDVNVR